GCLSPPRRWSPKGRRTSPPRRWAVAAAAWAAWTSDPATRIAREIKVRAASAALFHGRKRASISRINEIAPDRAPKDVFSDLQPRKSTNFERRTPYFRGIGRLNQRF